MTRALPHRPLPPVALAPVLALVLALLPAMPVPVRAQEPAFLTVQTAAGSRLNLRTDASATAAVVAQLGAGSTVRNLGCQTIDDRRWCRIAPVDAAGTEGWAAAEFLGAVPPPAAPDPLSAAETACLAAVAQQTDAADVAVLASDESRPDVLVQVGVGPERAPWQCLAAPDGSTRGIEYLGAEDAIPVATPAESACRAAVAQAAGIGMALVMSSSPTPAGTLVRLIVGTDPAPWTCVALADGGTTDIRRQGG